MVHILFVSQKVVDYKVPDLAGMDEKIVELRAWLQHWGFIPGEKVTGELRATKIEKKTGILECELSGPSLGFLDKSFIGDKSSTGLQPLIKLKLPTGLTSYSGKVHIRDILATIDGISIDDGGNIQNMLLNTMVLTEALSNDYPSFNNDNLRITIATSSDPFERLKTFKPDMKRVKISKILGMQDRVGLHFRFNQSGNEGTFVIVTEPELTIDHVRSLRKKEPEFAEAISSATCFVSADPIFPFLAAYAQPPYVIVVNASTNFRSLVATCAFGTAALLPMNQKEAGEVCKILLNRGGFELDQTQVPQFPSPLALSGDKIDAESLKTLDISIDKFSRYNQFFRHKDREEGISFACPISFGREGGLIIGLNEETIACFTSILSTEGEERLFKDYGFPKSEEIQDTGAGDSVAAVITLFNTVGPETIITPHFLGEESNRKDLKHLASTVFVGCLSRIIGNLLVRTSMTSLAQIQIKPLARLIQEVAKESVELSRRCVKLMPHPTFKVIEKWGIKVALWVPRRVSPGGPITI